MEIFFHGSQILLMDPPDATWDVARQSRLNGVFQATSGCHDGQSS